MNVIFAFTIKHFICDFLLQFPRHYLNKGTYGKWAGIEHALIHGIGTSIICFMFDLPYYFGALDFVIHYHIDFFKMAVNAKYKLQPNSAYFWHLLGLDQMLHYLTYWMLLSLR